MRVLRDASVLVVEDNAIIGMDIVCCLEDVGCRVHGPVSSPRMALNAISERKPDIATLDLNLGSAGTSVPIAQALLAISRPFVYVTANPNAVDGVDFPLGPTVSKPIDSDLLIRTLVTSLSWR